MFDGHPRQGSYPNSFDQSRALEIADAYKQNRVLRSSRNKWFGAWLVVSVALVATSVALSWLSNDLETAHRETRDAKRAIPAVSAPDSCCPLSCDDAIKGCFSERGASWNAR